jgi:hypothetical protein
MITNINVLTKYKFGDIPELTNSDKYLICSCIKSMAEELFDKLCFDLKEKFQDKVIEPFEFKIIFDIKKPQQEFLGLNVPEQPKEIEDYSKSTEYVVSDISQSLTDIFYIINNTPTFSDSSVIEIKKFIKLVLNWNNACNDESNIIFDLVPLTIGNLISINKEDLI